MRKLDSARQAPETVQYGVYWLKKKTFETPQYGVDWLETTTFVHGVDWLKTKNIYAVWLTVYTGSKQKMCSLAQAAKLIAAVCAALGRKNQNTLDRSKGWMCGALARPFSCWDPRQGEGGFSGTRTGETPAR